MNLTKIAVPFLWDVDKTTGNLNCLFAVCTEKTFTSISKSRQVKVEQITKADRFTRITSFAEMAKLAPRYGGLVPPSIKNKNNRYEMYTT